MPKKPGTILREYTEKYFVHLGTVEAQVDVFDGCLDNNKISHTHYMVTITWYAGTLVVEATKDNKLNVVATEAKDKGTFFNAFTVTGYYVMRDTIKAIWDSIECAVYSGNTSMEDIYNDIELTARLAAQP